MNKPILFNRLIGLAMLGVFIGLAISGNGLKAQDSPPNATGFYEQNFANEHGDYNWNAKENRVDFRFNGDNYYVEKFNYSDSGEDRLWTFTIRKKRGGGKVFDITKEDWRAEVHMTFHNAKANLKKMKVSVDTGENVSVKGLIKASGKGGGNGVEVDVLGSLQQVSKVFQGTGEKNEFATGVQHTINKMMPHFH